MMKSSVVIGGSPLVLLQKTYWATDDQAVSSAFFWWSPRVLRGSRALFLRLRPQPLACGGELVASLLAW